MSAVVLDASALLAMLRGARGAAKVAAAIADARISALDYAEVVGHFIRAGMPQDEVDMMLDPLPMTVLPMDKDLARIAARLRAATPAPGLSPAQGACLALARRDGLAVWTSDPALKDMAEAAQVKVVVVR